MTREDWERMQICRAKEMGRRRATWWHRLWRRLTGLR